MTFLDTQMHIVTFLITMFECAILFFVIIYYFSRPSDISRKRYLFLLLLLIMYNCFSGFFPDTNFALSIKIQNVLAYFGGVSVSMYFVYYIYKTFNLVKIKEYAVKGTIWLLFLPFIVFICVLYTVYGDLELSRRLVVLGPIIFAISFNYILAKTLYKIYNARTDLMDKEEVIGVYVSVLLWSALPFIVYFDGSQLVENSITNTGFMIMSVLFVRSSVYKSRAEYKKLKKSELKLQKMNDTLQQKVEERTLQLKRAGEQRLSAFHNLLHETKTPLTLINTYLDDIAEKFGSNEAMELTKQNLDKMTKNIVHIFDVNKMDQSLNVFDHDQVSNFTEILQTNIKLFRLYAAKNGNVINQIIEPEVYIKADPEAINRIVNNLLQNSIKYSTANGIIHIRLFIQDENIFFVVEDDGIGISKEHQKMIFEPFYQVNKNNHDIQGVGVGLSIVQQAVKSLNGSIELDSNINKGTTISIKLENHRIYSTDEKPTTNMANGNLYNPEMSTRVNDVITDSEFSNLLFVEDKTSMLQFYVNKFSSNYNIYVAKNGEEAIAKIKTIPFPDLIISDVMMNKMDGFAMVRIIRKQIQYQHIPIIFLTAKSHSIDKNEGLGLGAVDYITKPFDFKELKSKISSILAVSDGQKKALIRSAAMGIKNGHHFIDMNTPKIPLNEKCQQLNLTTRETDIVKLIYNGKSYKESAEQLYISEKTVSKHVSNIYKKLGVKNKIEMIKTLDS